MISNKEYAFRKELTKIIKANPVENVITDLLESIANIAYDKGFSAGQEYSEAFLDAIQELK